MRTACLILLFLCTFAAAGADDAAVRVKELKAVVDGNPTDQDALRELLVLYVVELDDPASARPYSREIDDPVWRECVFLASREVNELQEDDLLLAGKWYRGLAGKARGEPRVNLYERARGYFKRFVEVHGDKDELGQEAAGMLRGVEASLKIARRPRADRAKQGKPKPSPAADADDGLVLHWSFDADSVRDKKITDLSGHAHDGRITEGETTPSQRGAALAGAAQVADSPSLRHKGDYTLALWLHTPPLSVNDDLVGKAAQGRGNRQYTLAILADDSALATYAGSVNGTGEPVTAAPGTLEYGSWTHVIVTQEFDGKDTHVRFYKNGQPAGEGQAHGKTLNSPAPLLISSALGQVDDVRLYHLALSPDQAAALHKNESSESTPVLAREGPANGDGGGDDDENRPRASGFFGITIE